MLSPARRVGATTILLASLLADLSDAKAAAKLVAYDVLPASEASTIVGLSLKSQLMGSSELPSYVFLAKDAVFGMMLVSFPSEVAAASRLESAKAKIEPLRGWRQHGSLLVGAYSTNHDGSKIDTLLDAAAKHL